MIKNQKGDKLFGLRVKELREKKGYTQEQLSELIDMDIRSLSRIETGISFTTFDKLKKISNALDVSIQDLFTTEHFQKKDELINKIISILTESSLDKVKIIYRLVLTILR